MLDALVMQANALPRLRTLVLIMFSIVAVGIVALGSYGAMSQLVSNRNASSPCGWCSALSQRSLGRP